MYEINVSITEKVNSFEEKLNALETVGAEAEFKINLNDHLRIETNKKKYDVIIETLMPIFEGYKRLCEIAEKYKIPFYYGLQSRLGVNHAGVMQSIGVCCENGNIKCSYYDGDRSHSVYPYNDEEDNYSSKGIITRWNEHHIIEDFEKDLNMRIEQVYTAIKKRERESVEAFSAALK